ncbi:MAG TPA: phosphatidylserine/phosphatidylglycerophosphate/cardiolipin synthase family protein [Rectinemataceae bacterium]
MPPHQGEKPARLDPGLSSGPRSSIAPGRAATLVRAVALGLGLLLASCATAPAPATGAARTSVATGPASWRAKAGKVGSILDSKGIPSYPSSEPSLYFTSQAWGERALHLIESARDYILVDSFLLNYHEINEPIMAALAAKARGGVRVFLIFDSSTYFTYMPNKIDFAPAPQRYFEGSGVRLAEYNAMSGLRLFDLPTLLDRDHRKFIVVDGRAFATGGINLNYYSMLPPGPNGNVDAFVEVESPATAKAMVESFCETWNGCSPFALDPADFAIADIPASAYDSGIWLVDQAPGQGSPVNDLFDAFFRGAEKELWLLEGYAFLTPSLKAKVKEASERGVDVHLVLSMNSVRPSFELAAKYCILDWLDAGAKVHMYESPVQAFLHYKLLLADGKVAAYGSPNFNYRSQYLSREAGIVTADPRAIAATMAHLETILKDCRDIGRAEAKTYRGPLHAMTYLAMIFGG